MNRKIANVRPVLEKMDGSGIRRMFALTRNRADAVDLLLGEPDFATAPPVVSAAVDALQAGHTRYVSNLGIEPLRLAISHYLSTFERSVDPERICVTASGINAVSVACMALIESGSRVITFTPQWPHHAALSRFLGAHVSEVELLPTKQGWKLDDDWLAGFDLSGVGVIITCSPGNPTGFVLTRKQQTELLAASRRYGFWIIADEVYERLTFESEIAPSFLDITDSDDNVIVINSFSKAWSMTGWRLGWIVAPRRITTNIGKVIELTTSCAPPFVQLAGIAALQTGESEIRNQRRLFVENKDLMIDSLSRIPGICFAPPMGGMYVFCGHTEVQDADHFCEKLLELGGVAVAPGSAFGKSGSDKFRICFARRRATVEEGCRRLQTYLESVVRARIDA